MITRSITHLANKYITNGSNTHVDFYYYFWVDIYCQSPHWTDTNSEIVMKKIFLPLHLGMYLLSDMEYV